MDLKHVVPNMEATFGKLTFAGEGEVVQGYGRNAKPVSRTYNLFSNKQRADDVAVVVTGNTGQHAFDFEDEVVIVNPRIMAKGVNINGFGYTDYTLYADDIVKKDEMQGK